MPSERTARYPLRSSNLPTSDDLWGSRERSHSSLFQSFGVGPQTNMLGQSGYSTSACSDSIYAPRHYPTQGSFPTPMSSLHWNGLQDHHALHGTSSQRVHHQDLYGSHYGGAYGRTSSDNVFEDSQWACELSHDPMLTYPSMTCPPTYHLETDPATKSAVGPKSQAYPPSAFSAESLRQSPNQRIPQYLQFQSELPTASITDALGLYPVHQSLHSLPHAPSQSSPHCMKLDDYSTVTPDPLNGDGTAGNSANMKDDETDGDGSVSSEPYAQLIFRALKSAPEHKMVLKEIYDWFERNTDKAKSSTKGWQNSIRHNLSMNGAFKKVDQAPPTDESKKGFIWVLEPSAFEKGVESTTRYRRTVPNKKIGRSDPPATQRQRSGAKGGKAARKAAKLRRSARFDEPRNLRFFETATDTNPIAALGSDSNSAHDADMYQLHSMPYYLNTPSSTVQSSASDSSPYGFDDITGCANGLGDEPLFYDDFDGRTESMLPSPSFCDSGESLLGCDIDYMA
ncbi:hypothetical protein MMC24_005587 [Lignoscripta atroalba]|nr:hypothetical protein [Lignoscripta atroalba]